MPRGAYYVDNSQNRRLGRAGMPMGSMPVSRSSSGCSSSGRVYVDNAFNRGVGRVGMPLGSMVVSKGDSSPRYSSSGCLGYSGMGFSDLLLSEDVRSAVMDVYGYIPRHISQEFGFGSPRSSPVPRSEAATDVVSSLNDGHSQRRQHASFPVSNPNVRIVPAASSPVDANVQNHNRGQVGDQQTTPRGSNDRRGAAPPGGSTALPSATNARASTGPRGQVIDQQSSSTGSNSNDERTVLSASRRDAENAQRCRPKLRSDGGTNKVKDTVCDGRGASSTAKPRRRVYGDNSLNRARNRVGHEVGTRTGLCSEETEWLRTAYEIFKEQTDEHLDFENLPAMPCAESKEKLVNLLRKMSLDDKLQRKSTTKSRLRTSPSLLEFDWDSGENIQFGDLKLGGVIGNGGFGVVRQAVYKNSLVAVKKLRVTKVSERRLKDFTDEVYILSYLDHPGIVKFIGACVTKPNLCIVMEYMQMSLHELLHVRSAEIAELTDDDRLTMIKQTIAGLEYLHKLNIAHCDIKSGNVLIDHDGTKFTAAKLTDFGLSIMKHEVELDSTSAKENEVRNVGRPRYSAPEVLSGEILGLREMKMSDMYSYALVAFEIVVEEEPFAKLSRGKLREQVLENSLLPMFPDGIHVNIELLAVLLCCWEREGASRPSASDFSAVVSQLKNVYDTTGG